ncbi:MAG: hypothetical protein P8Z80_10025 [Pseudolabrys sp.]
MPFGDNWHTPHAMTEADMDGVREAFVASAQRALRLGFDVIELPMAHGYLPHELTSPVTNQRTDQYGGSLENHLRFPLSVAKAARASHNPQAYVLWLMVGNAFPVVLYAFWRNGRDVGVAMRRFRLKEPPRPLRIGAAVLIVCGLVLIRLQ